LCSREQEPHERQTREVPTRSGSFLKGPARRNGRAGGERSSQHSGEDRTPGGKLAGLRSRGKVRRGIPRGRRSDVGGAPEANKALLDGHYNTLQGTGTSRESGCGGQPSVALGDAISQVSGEATRKPRSAFARKGEGRLDARPMRHRSIGTVVAVAAGS
jgi:hypothetical protein